MQMQLIHKLNHLKIKTMDIKQVLQHYSGLNHRIRIILEYYYDRTLREIIQEINNSTLTEEEKTFLTDIFYRVMEENWPWAFQNFDTEDEENESFLEQLSNY